MSNSIILDYINNQINNHINDYKTKNSLFKPILVSKNYDSVNTVYVVKNNIKYQGIEFCIGLEYRDKEMKVLFEFNEPTNNGDHFIEIAGFIKHFSEINIVNIKLKIEDYLKKN